MARHFTINGTRYEARKFDFNTVCDLEDNGVSIADLTKKPMSLARAYFALCLNGDKEKAGAEIEAHVKAKGDFNELYNVIGEELNESDFFQALNQNQDKDAPEMENEKTEKAEKAAK